MKQILTLLIAAASLASLSACSPGQVANAIKTGQIPVGNTNGNTNGNNSSSSSNGAATSFPASVKAVATQANSSVEVKGNLDDGQTISDLSWAANSSVACFPATQNSKFRAKHSLFHTSLPPRSILKIKLIPDDKSKAMSLYAYQIGATSYNVVPNLSSAVTCEADHINDRPVAGKVEDGTRTVTLNATTNPYNIVVGVSGSEGVSGGYTLQFELQQ